MRSALPGHHAAWLAPVRDLWSLRARDSRKAVDVVVVWFDSVFLRGPLLSCLDRGGWAPGSGGCRRPAPGRAAGLPGEPCWPRGSTGHMTEGRRGRRGANNAERDRVAATGQWAQGQSGYSPGPAGTQACFPVETPSDRRVVAGGGSMSRGMEMATLLPWKRCGSVPWGPTAWLSGCC